MPTSSLGLQDPDPSELGDVLFSSSPIGILLLRPLYAADSSTLADFACERLNPAAQRLLRLPERPTGSLLTLLPAAAQAGVFAWYRDAFEADQITPVPTPYYHDQLDGYQVLVAQREGQLLLVYLQQANGNASDQQATQSQARAQVAERQRQQLYTVFEQAPAMICIFDGPQHTFEFVNPPYQALVGERPLVGRPIAQAMPELAGQPIFDLLDSVYQTGETFAASEMLVQLDHHNVGAQQLEQRYYNFIYQARRDGWGTIDGILVFAYDVTVQVLARQQVQDLNEELAAINEELRASNEEYLLSNTALLEAQQQLEVLNHELEARVQARTREVLRIFAQAPQAIVVLRGPNFIIEQANENTEAIWGRSVADVLGQPHFEAIPDSAGQGFEELLTGVLQSGEPVVLHEVPIDLNRAHTGRPARGYYSILFKPLRDEQEQVTGVAVMWTEETDQVLARQRVNALNEELAAINEELTATNEELLDSNRQLLRTNADLDTFVYTASHDLKSPIANIEGLLNALNEELTPTLVADPGVAPLLTMMRSSISRFRETIGHLTSVTHLQQAGAGGREQATLAPLVEGVRQDLAPSLVAARGQLLIDLDGCSDLLIGARDARAIISNLLSNAIKYRAPDRPLLIQLRAHCTKHQVVLTVQDNGLGLSDEQQGQLFGLFRRLHNHVDGSGVGLYSIKKIIENLHGQISVTSKLGVGSTFTVTLPI
jgi:signal transduction histidine kinase